MPGSDVIFHEMLLLLAIAVVVVALFRRANLPAILGYLFVGTVVGPHGLAWIPDSEDTRLLAQFGVVFLMFTLGLEFSRPQLLTMKGTVLGLGGSQVLLTIALLASVSWLLGVNFNQAFVLGGVVALSSTAIVIKQLAEQLELNSRHGRLGVGILLFQDLAVIPLLVVIPVLGTETGQPMIGLLAGAVLKGAVAFIIVLASGRWLLRPLFHEIAARRSRELFMLTVLLVTLAAAWITQQAGLSLTLGAFLAGMMLGETEFRHQIEADIRPFQDVLLGLFFVTVGMLVDVGQILGLWPWVLLLVLAITVLKGLMIVVLALAAQSEPGVALRSGIILAQGGEFGFVLLAEAHHHRLLTTPLDQILLGSILVSMALAPFLIRYNGRLAKYLLNLGDIRYSGRRTSVKDEIRIQTRGISNHVIVCGYGRTGQIVGRFLEREAIDYVGLDLDPASVHNARRGGRKVSYGDATRPALLDAAALERACAVIVTFAHPPSALKIIHHARIVRPDIPIVVRAQDDSELHLLKEAGATEVIPDLLEASLMLSSHLLYLLDIPAQRILQHSQEIRSDRYQLLGSFFSGAQSAAEPDLLPSSVSSRKIHLHPQASAVGRTLAETAVQTSGASLIALQRHGIRGSQPDPETLLHAGDVVIVQGTLEQLQRAQHLLLEGEER